MAYTDKKKEVQQYSSNYAAEINRRKSINPNDPLIPYLETARYQKVMSSPELKAKYGGDYENKIPTLKNNAIDNQLSAISNFTKLPKNVITDQFNKQGGLAAVAEYERNKSKTPSLGPGSLPSINNSTTNYSSNKIPKTSDIAYDPKKTQQYEDPRISQALQAIANYSQKRTPYDPSKDVGLQQAMEYARNEALKELAKRNIMEGRDTAASLAQVSQRLIPQYEQLYNQQQQQDLDNLYNQLAAITGVSNDAYNRSVTERNLAFNQDITGQQMALQKDQFAHSKSMDIANMLGSYIDPNYKSQLEAPIPQDVMRQVQQYSNNYATEINRRKSINPNDPLIPYLESARYQKIMSDPILRARYGGDYGIPTLDKVLSDAQLKGISFDNAQKELNLEYLPRMLETELKSNELNLVSKQIDNMLRQIDLKYYDDLTKVNVANAREALRANQLQNAYQSIVNSILPEKFKWEISEIMSNIAYRNKSASLLGTSKIPETGLAGVEEYNADEFIDAAIKMFSFEDPLTGSLKLDYDGLSLYLESLKENNVPENIRMKVASILGIPLIKEDKSAVIPDYVR